MLGRRQQRRAGHPAHRWRLQHAPARQRLHLAGGGGPAATLRVAAGGQFSCALLFDGTVWCWGLNHRGQLGRGYASDTEPPAPVDHLAAVTTLAVGHDHACAVVGGEVKCWGENLAGFSSTRPTTIAGLSNVYALIRRKKASSRRE